MGGSRQQQQQTQQQTFGSTNTYGWLTPPETADFSALRNYQFQRDPRIPHTFARQRTQLHEGFHNPLGGYTTPQLRDAIIRTGEEDSAQNEAQAYREEDYGHQALKYAQLSDLATFTQPRSVQTGSSGSSSGSSSGTSQTSQSPFNSIVQGGSAIGSALIM